LFQQTLIVSILSWQAAAAAATAAAALCHLDCLATDLHQLHCMLGLHPIMSAIDERHGNLQPHSGNDNQPKEADIRSRLKHIDGDVQLQHDPQLSISIGALLGNDQTSQPQRQQGDICAFQAHTAQGRDSMLLAAV
jgi:hypothetical protein